jgi:hypothetical protein
MRILMIYTGLFSLLVSSACATVLNEPSCSVKAKILEIGTQQNNPAIKLRIISLDPVGPSGNCDFLKTGQIITASGGSSLNILKKDETMKTLAGYNLGMGPDGVVPFIHWQPLTHNGIAIPEELDFHLQSSAE